MTNMDDIFSLSDNHPLLTEYYFVSFSSSSKDNVLTPLPVGRYPDAFKNNLPFRYYTTKEMCRLQTVPDDFLNMIPDSAARKALGNGWTVDVIAHIFSFLPNEYKISEVDV